MAKNYMADVAKLLGVELEEEFNIVASNIYIDCMLVRYMLNAKGIFYYSEARKSWQSAADFILLDLLTGKKTIKKLPWKPKEEEHYYYVGWYYSKEKEMFVLDVLKGIFLKESALSNLNSFLQNCFKTYKEAEAQKHEVFKRLTGEEWNEMYGKGGDGNV